MSKYRIEIKWAIIYTIVMLLWTLGERLAGLHDKYIASQENYSLLVFVPIILIYLFENLDKRNNYYKGNMTYLQGFFTGIWLTACILLLTPIIQLASTYVISPHLFENLITYSVQSGKLPQQDAEKYFTYGNFVFINIVFEMITGVAISAFITIWTRNNKEEL